MKKVILLFAVLAVIAVGWFLYFDEGEPVTHVSLYNVKYSKLENALEFSGEVVPSTMYSVMSETGGTVAQMHVSEGSRVSAGDTLFAIDDSEVSALLKEAQLRLSALRDLEAQAVFSKSGGAYGIAQERAKLALALSQTTGYDYESFNAAFDKETAEQVQAVTASLSESLSGIDAGLSQGEAVIEGSQTELAQLAVERLEKSLEKMTYKSRISGTVIAVNINKGEVLSPGLPAMVVADTDCTKIVGYVYEKDVKDLSTGMDVKIITDIGNFNGVVTRIGAAASGVGDMGAFDTMAKIEIEPESAFSKMVGAAVDLKIVLSGKQNVLAIPIDSLTDDGCVFVIGEGDIAQKRAVVTGFEDVFNVEVVGGLSEGERIVAASKDLQEGQRLSYDRS